MWPSTGLSPPCNHEDYIRQIRRLTGCPDCCVDCGDDSDQSDQISQHFIFQELDAVNKLITDGKAKANDIRNNLKNLETTSTRFVVSSPYISTYISTSHWLKDLISLIFKENIPSDTWKVYCVTTFVEFVADFYLFCGDNFEWHSKPQTSSTCAL